ncbi:hypothetical protein BX600DRAFT_429122 [Xylariales sp. PMI_506]|nr:hypothetical protein BX600DRAFT_429122 [Xylariales sp. PMI_506]
MPPVNHVAVTAGVFAVTLVVAAGIALYESPELRRMAEDLRRRIAVALYSLGDSISPQQREELLNRPEDAEGFLRSRGIDINNEPGVDADEETRRRQREELMYWNAIAEEKRKGSEKEKVSEPPARPRTSTRGSSFDDFLKQDSNAEKGAFVFHTGTDIRGDVAEGLRRRGDMPRGLNYSAYTNPFGDEHGIDENIIFENSLIDPEKDETETDIYSVSHDGQRDQQQPPTIPAVLNNADSIAHTNTSAQLSAPVAASESELGPDEFMTAGQDDRHDAYSSIQAWAQNSNSGFYSPLPVSPAGPLSEPELISEGQLTPTDSVSLIGSGDDVADEARSTASYEQGRHYDVLSDDEGMMTPASWTEVGSVVSELDNSPTQLAHAQ